jgi:hypothetical protein
MSLKIMGPLKDWLRPCWRDVWAKYPAEEYVAIVFKSGDCFDRIFDSGISIPAHGIPGIIPAGESMHMLFPGYSVIPMKYLPEVVALGVVTKVRRLPVISGDGKVRQ